MAVPEVGTTWRSELGGHPMTVVAVEGGFAYMKRADAPKMALTIKGGSYETSLGEFERGEWLPFAPRATVRVLHVTRRGVVSLDGKRLGYVVRNAERLYEGFNEIGRCLFANADCKTTAMSLLARRTGALRVGDQYRITGVPSATGGPWTVAE